MRMTRQYVFGSKQNDTPCTKYKITEEEWVQFKESRLTPEWQVYHLEKQPIAQPVNKAREEAEDHDVISILTSKLNKLRKGPVEMLWELRTFGLECHVPLYINFDDAYEIIGGEKMLNISCIQLWCMYMDTIVVESGRASVYGFLEPQTIQPSENHIFKHG
ncbi:hypothetical protein LR48_Vigan02g083500 [Vigna angularis]|uniref:Uncharacterized protein n=1 Tax=Phaseolus angularis TaxID=3914 RepID=A0A0L9TVV1_PHAAN|nr:hypothetical protein LR48_Vigan02g083500 [Vigna angularis]